ncbi:hypothetical protein [Legionella pneumophila]|uniref:Ubiquitin-like protease family profile domain-containing protein n=1 Tax=Legionella pneumophila subsp. pascullei TaxID=91890 RepID=A0AAX2IZ91_LEGPN|nr:hypothetical protein [Legionella pneumophila]AMP89040.1 hypothetical protein AXF35_04800 [Legionella pneumophila subsp. pascullei]AMP93292.1 hypothetical protein AXF36_11990 [Legionella pneumophila subsp. pascullei]AMP96258.1 hypothetical protein AXF37_11880 [Legionella pneumophila subsp. pascullei]SQG91216.1 Uncharacterised protein [Legionella pneumophila subsp. pascullei]VEH07762.1 Uncharacterised protein [Legionella pneumophila subsp. pascullei]
MKRNNKINNQDADQKSRQYIYVEKKEIGGIDTEIITESHYPIPWDSSSERPLDYYEKQSKTITYYKEDVDLDNNPVLKRIEIEIPIVEEGENRHRTIKVKVDGKLIIFQDDSILDMDKSFNIRDVNLLVHMVLNNFHPKSKSTRLQTITPFIHLPGTGGDKDYEFNQKNNGDISKILLPYVQEMCSLKNSCVVRELLIPVATKGGPHHWNLCMLSIDENNIPALYYIESENLLVSFHYYTYMYYMEDYKMHILPQVNELLAKFHYPAIDKVNFSQAKQFSQEGCGIAMGLNMQKILEENYPQVICHSNTQRQEVPSLAEIGRLSSNVSIEEDALMRVELAFKIQARASIITERALDAKMVEKKSLVCSEILSDSRSLNVKAKEAFGFFQSAQPEISTEMHSTVAQNKDNEEASPIDINAEASRLC